MNIQIDNTALTAALDHAASQLTHTAPLMQRLSTALMTETEENFASQGRPAWAGLSPVTLARRRGSTHQILHDTGQLAASVTNWHSATEAGIGSISVYARTHQFGAAQGSAGRTRRNGPVPWGDIPARPFLPMTSAGDLQPEAETGLLDVVSAYLRTVIP